MEFKPGDKIVCINNKHCSSLILNKVYTVSMVKKDCLWLEGTHIAAEYLKWRFKKYTPIKTHLPDFL